MSAPHLLFASDSLKGTLSSADTARLLRQAAREVLPDAQSVSVPMADGGEGTAEALATACGGEMVQVTVHGPRGDPVRAAYAQLPGGRAVIEMAAAAGITLVERSRLDPTRATTYGVGELILHAVLRGCTDITVALGGSATNDGGVGMLVALGARLYDETGEEVAGTPSNLGRIANIDPLGLRLALDGIAMHAMCDVDNPLTGPNGATYTFGPQKGATPEVLDQLEGALCVWEQTLADACGYAVGAQPGAGAAGGLGAACLGLLGADLKPGIDTVLELVGFDELLAQADLCVTGEGWLDAQTAHGKVIAGVAAACERAGVPCVAIVGGMDAGAEALPGLTTAVPLTCAPMSLDEALARAEELYALAARRTLALFGAGWGSA